ncbi:GNAT family N-acetyltransferase [uncultured Paracoccus sp.]|uniref:GNAT family N-acetyltransferase n=1 Tax=uncultured Paracoccus sp. TaxID=189685 RepID=UPI002618A4C9|nr:GNAT family N-acetyltransferase [uncultured Paracoccus sp.]
MEIRAWQPGDEAAILDLFATTFGTPMTEAYWRWRYLDHPAGGPLIALAWDENRLAAHYAASRAPLLVDGTPLQAALSMTTMTHPDYRGQGLFERTASVLYEQMAQDGIHAVWGFPNRNSNVPFRRKLDWSAISDVPVLVRDIRPDESLSPDSLVPADHVDERFSSVASPVEGLQGDRRADLLSWRIDQNPNNRYLILTLPGGDGLDGYAVLKPYGDAEFDLVLMAAGDARAYPDLIAGSLAAAKARGARRVNCWSLPQDPARIALERAGFQASAPVTYFGGRVLSGQDAGLSDARRWRIAMIDSDIY